MDARILQRRQQLRDVLEGLRDVVHMLAVQCPEAGQHRRADILRDSVRQGTADQICRAVTDGPAHLLVRARGEARLAQGAVGRAWPSSSEICSMPS